MGYENNQGIFLWGAKLFSLKNIYIKFGNDESFDRYENRLGHICVHIYLKRPQRVMDGVPNNFVEGLWGTNCFSIFKIGYEIFSYCVKLSSAPRIKSDRSLSNTAPSRQYHSIFFYQD